MFEPFFEHLPGLLLTYGAFLILLLSPGPNVMAVMGTSMSVNRASGIALGLGIAGGTLFWSSMTVFGITSIVATYAWAITILKVFGGIYLLWLALKSFRLACSEKEDEISYVSERSRFQYLIRGFTLNVSNPKAAFGWIALVSLGMESNSPVWVSAALIAGTVLTSIVFHFLYAVLFSTPPMITLYRRGRRWIQAIFGAFFIGAGVKVLTSRS